MRLSGSGTTKQAMTSQSVALASLESVTTSRAGRGREWEPRQGKGRTRPSLPGFGPEWWKVGTAKRRGGGGGSFCL